MKRNKLQVLNSSSLNVLKHLPFIRQAFGFNNFSLKIVLISIWSLNPLSTVPDFRATCIEGTLLNITSRQDSFEEEILVGPVIKL